MKRSLGILVILAFFGASAVMVWQHLHREREEIVVRVLPAAAPEMPPTSAPPPPPPPAPAPAATPTPAALPSVPVAPAEAPADAHEDGNRPERMQGESGVTYLIRVLRNSRDFRVRAQVALALGRIGSRRAERALLAALFDEHPAVRAASAEALGGIGGDEVVAAVRSAAGREADASAKVTMERVLARLAARATTPAPAREQAVRPSGRYLVAIARPSAAGHSVTSGQLAELDHIVRNGVVGLSGVQLVGQGTAGGSDVTGFHLDVAVSELQDDGHGTARAVVSIMVSTYPGRELRGIIKGKTTVEDLGEASRAAMVALEGAAKSAVRQLPSTFERAAMR